MRINVYLVTIFLCFVTQSAFAQEKFTKKELYSVWMSAEEKLDAGQMNEALVLYRSYPKDSSFMLRLRQIRVLNDIVAESDKLYKKEQYAESLDKVKEYRKLRDLGTLRFLEEKIEDCLNQINKGKVTELTAQQRVITGFEFAHRGREKLSKLDTAGAKRDFNNAKALGGNRNSILKEQYVEGQRITAELTNWGKEHLNIANESTEKKMESLSSYRNIRNIDIPDIELEINKLKNDPDGQTSASTIAKLCDTDLLIKHVDSHKSEFKTSDFLLRRLREFKSTRQKINTLKQHRANAETVKSAYESLLSWTDDLPAEFQQEVKSCIQTEYSEYVSTLPDTQTPTTDILKCEGQASFEKSLAVARKELANCNIVRSKILWEEAFSFVKNCNNASTLLKANATLKDSINRFVKSDSVLTILRKRVIESAASEDCQKVLEVYEQMRSLRVCDQDALNEEIKTGIANAKTCKNDSWWKPQIIASVAGVAPTYSVGDVKKNMATGWMASGGIGLYYIDPKNLVEFLTEVQYFKTNYYTTESSSKSAVEDFTISGVNIALGIKLHKPNKEPDKLRPYFRFGPEIQIPVSYEYKNYSTATESDGLEDLQKTLLFVSGGVGVEIQRERFGAFIEAFGAVGLGNIYNSGVSHLSSSKQKVDAAFNKFGIKVGIRLW
ncbi:hypothetical protein [Dyadobacter chenhuakuii]|uniref:Outer membrane protein with beta-barrel domain n=1 Tax=Dyadobacter chenhuakuii TaxID=2909339 RepID=A0A9X1QFG9_9BACT|nr:hypothetical protein [Dyadobacter chenhuakuii]MCF2500420.1 hypothetical protein [Dyadobacter chenhuakuii]